MQRFLKKPTTKKLKYKQTIVFYVVYTALEKKSSDIIQHRKENLIEFNEQKR